MNIQNPDNIRFYCPNPNCPYHAIGGKIRRRFERLKFFWKIGSYVRKNGRSKVPRYKCRHCKTTFSASLVSIDYRVQKRGLSPKIFSMHVDGISNRQIGRNLGVDETLIRTRLKVLSQQSLLNHAHRMRYQKIREVIAYDGVENFAKSQYEPNNINQAIGMDSQFVYDFNFSPLNRKGRTSDRQKLKKEKLEKSFGRFPIDAIRTSTEALFHRLHSKWGLTDQPLCIVSDQHFLYRKVIEIDMRKHGIIINHQTISSKAPRTFKSVLHAVNHTDLLLRQFIKAFARETISFSKTHAAMIQKYAIFMVWKNYLRVQFIKSHKQNPKSNTQSPAMVLGVTNKVLRFRDFFGTRKMLSQVQMNNEWRDYYASKVPNLRVLAA